ncbi:MAG: DUF3108 domain-containing protein [Bacteroidetes bacterium]|nr:MAG: DUF3108 domain-containing protein [Bacteroidota bacterium]
MKSNQKILIIFAFLLSSSFIVGDGGYRSAKNNKFQRGEFLTYLVHYSFVNAGEATVFMDKDLHTINNRACYKVDIVGRSIGMLSMTYKINDLWQSFIDTGAIIPQKFHRNIQENNYRKKETVIFDHLKKTSVLTHKTFDDPEVKKEYPIPMNVQDMVSGYYYLRTLDFANLKVGDTLSVDGYLEGQIYDFKIRFVGREKLRTEFGKIRTAIISPILPETQLFKGRDALKVWISDDENRVPIKIQAELFVGAIELDLIDHKGLRSKFKKD